MNRLHHGGSWRAFTLAGLLLASFDAAAGVTSASSELKTADGVRHGAGLAFDGLLRTGWAEGDAGSGEGAWLELRLGGLTEVASVHLWPGNLSQGERSLREYGRPRAVTITLTGGAEEVTKQVVLDDGATVGPRRVDIPIEGQATAIRVTIDQAYEGIVYGDTFIAEMAINLTGGDVPAAVERLEGWGDTAAGKRSVEAARAHVVELFGEVASAGTEGAAEALAGLVDRAADGIPDLRARVLRDVPAGFRVHALGHDETAVDALLKLKDPNGIPGVELASLRATGKLQRRLALQTEMFRAHQELIGGPAQRIPPWGASGWADGALRGFGEPMSAAVDQHGFVYVADLANNRVQKFDEGGMVVRAWGGEPEIVNRWFSGTRTYYVAASAPEPKPGRFVNPVGITTVPGKHADGFAVLDAAGRVQVFDPGGNLLLQWELRTEDTVEPGLGGQGYLLASKGKLVAVWGDQVFVYAPSSEELANFELTDGAPSGAVVLKNGKLGLVYGQQLVMYSLDGFRHGGVLGAEIGTGFEDWDVALDHDGRLWAVTDTGWILKYKKPGKLEYKVRFTDRPLGSFRFAVRDGVVFLVEGDRIERIDALELHTREQAAQEAG